LQILNAKFLSKSGFCRPPDLHMLIRILP